MSKRRYSRRPARPQPLRKKHVESKTGYSNPRIDPGLRPVFRKIGVPDAGPFLPDPFQLEALRLIREYDVLVSAPTGAGKTWIASQTIHSYLTKNLRTWYASPLKALSNSIYQEFCREFGSHCCGIITGDRKENPEAPIIVGTTEILRNQLYDAMHQGTSIRADLVILDEAHYLNDPDRGVVWEEVLIYLPSRVRLLLLSATISNAEEVGSWLKTIRGLPNRTVRKESRPVTLEMLFLFPDGLLVTLAGKRGLSPRVKKFLYSGGSRLPRRAHSIDFGKIIHCLRKFDLLPAIFFLKSRMDCDRALHTCPSLSKPFKDETLIKETLKSLLKDYPHLKGHRQTRNLLDSKVASHHGGQLPYWKVVVEKMMNKGYLDAIFSTSTVAAGVNFPARTVVLVQSDRFNGHEFTDLTATELHQMIGRAGRRGKDNIGFAIIIPGAYQDPQLIYELKDSKPEPIMSQIKINFSMTLNLLLSHTPLEVKDLVERSFAAFQERKLKHYSKDRWNELLLDLKNTLPKGKCDTADPYEVLENIDKRRELRKKIEKLVKATRYESSIDTILDSFEKRLRSMPCETCEHINECHGKAKSALRKCLRDLRSLADHMSGTGDGLWVSFKRHLRFLKETGFVDEDGKLTLDGYWASKLRLDQPLLIAEAIRNRALEGVSPEILAGGLAPFVWDRTQELEVGLKTHFDFSELEGVFNSIRETIKGIRRLKKSRGFETPPILFWPAAALFMWAKGAPWEELFRSVAVDEGDMASLVMRTADHLRQVGNLQDTHPNLAFVAEKAIDLILREPVYID